MSSDVAYYNEFDPYVAQWLRNLITAGHIAPGIVDERSIEDVTPNDLVGFTQCHFFAGIGVWSLALRCAGWPDSRPIWTGSCPCQPFSTAGEGAGFADERHLWPAFHHLIAERRPSEVVGEQVAGGPVGPWIDLVHADMEGLGYSFGCVPFPSAGVGAPHIRDRLYWVADADSQRLTREHALLFGCQLGRDSKNSMEATRRGEPGSLAYPGGERPAQQRWQRDESARPSPPSILGGLADAADIRQHGRLARLPCNGGDAARVEPQRLCDAGDGTGPTNGYWRDTDWLSCTDGKWRPVEPGTFPLAAGPGRGVGRVRASEDVPRKDQGSRQGRLKGYGNAINKEAAVAFIRSIM